MDIDQIMRQVQDLKAKLDRYSPMLEEAYAGWDKHHDERRAEEAERFAEDTALHEANLTKQQRQLEHGQKFAVMAEKLRLAKEKGDVDEVKAAEADLAALDAEYGQQE